MIRVSLIAVLLMIATRGAAQPGGNEAAYISLQADAASPLPVELREALIRAGCRVPVPLDHDISGTAILAHVAYRAPILGAVPHDWAVLCDHGENRSTLVFAGPVIENAEPVARLPLVGWLYGEEEGCESYFEVRPLSDVAHLLPAEQRDGRGRAAIIHGICSAGDQPLHYWTGESWVTATFYLTEADEP